MRKTFHAITMALALGMPAIPTARAAGPAPEKVASTARASHVTLEDLGNQALPNLQFNNNGLRDVLDFISDTVPGFQYTLTFDPHADSDLVFPSMKAQGLTLSQFLEVLKNVYPQIEITPVPGPNRPLYVFYVGLSKEQQAATDKIVMPVENQAVKLYNLHAAIDTLLSNKGKPSTDETRKAALGDLLGLINTALGDGRPLGIQIHQPTETLIFHGPANKAAILQQLLSEFDAVHAGEMKKGSANYAHSDTPATQPAK